MGRDVRVAKGRVHGRFKRYRGTVQRASGKIDTVGTQYGWDVYAGGCTDASTRGMEMCERECEELAHGNV